MNFLRDSWTCLANLNLTVIFFSALNHIQDIGGVKHLYPHESVFDILNKSKIAQREKCYKFNTITKQKTTKYVTERGKSIAWGY